MNAEYARPSCHGWQYAPLGAVGIVTLGKMLSPSPKSPSDSTRPYLRAAHIQPQGRLDFDVTEKTMWFSEAEVDSLDLQEGDIVIVEGGAGYGRSALINKPLDGWGFQNSIVRVRPNIRKGHSPYIRYALQLGYDSKMIELECFTATLPHFTAEKVSRFRIPLPDLPTQRRIADYLDRETAQLDAMAEALDQLVARLKERRRSIVSNLIRIAESFDDLRQSTRLGLVSEVIRRGISPSYANEGLPVVNQKCVRKNGVFEPKFRRNHSESKRRVSQELILQEGDALVNSTGTGTLGRSCIVRGISEHTTWDSHVTVVRPRKQLLLPSFLNFILLENENRFVELSQGSTNQIELSRDVVFNLSIPLPPLDEQRRIADHLDAETAKIDAMIAKAGELRALLDERRSALITATVTGQHPVPEEP